MNARSLALSFALVLSFAIGSPTSAVAKPADAERAFVIATRAQVRKRPSKSAKSLALLPIGTEVERLARPRSGYVRIKVAGGIRGFVRTRDLVTKRPSLEVALREFDAAPKGSRARRTWIERATALAPGDLAVIDRLQAELLARGDKKWNYYARKGWIAAKRRTFMWDGPLYPIVRRHALLPLPCGERATANGKRKPSAIPNLELRARAFPIVSSGKVVSVTAKKNVTQSLREPLCRDRFVAYRLPKMVTHRRIPDGRGALVASWLVAGHTVLPFFKAKDGAHKAGRFTIDVDNGNATVVENTLDGPVSSSPTLLPLVDATPVAVFFDETTTIRVLFWSPSPPSDAPACADAGPSAFIVRYAPADDAAFESAASLAKLRTSVDVGRVWASRAPKGCDVVQFSPLPGEPRDISHERLESDDWKQ